MLEEGEKVMIEFVLGIASSVLANVITELVTGQRKAARMEEIKKEVGDQIEKDAQLQNVKLAQMQQLVLEEMSKLIERDPSLKFANNRIELKKPLEIPFLSPKREVEDELKTQLEHLQIVVLARRQELHLPPEPIKVSPSSTLHIDDVQDSRVEWKQVRKEEVENQTAQEIRKMRENIDRRRSGGGIVE